MPEAEDVEMKELAEPPKANGAVGSVFLMHLLLWLGAVLEMPEAEDVEMKELAELPEPPKENSQASVEHKTHARNQG